LAETLHSSYIEPKSLSSRYNSLIYSNPNNLVVRLLRRTYLHDQASATTFSWPCLYLITYGKVSINSIHLACHLFSLPWPFKCFNDWWSVCITNSQGHR
jgi:hypothetical protein